LFKNCHFIKMYNCGMLDLSLQLSQEGRILVPQQVRAALGLAPHMMLHGRLVDGGLFLEPAHQKLSRAYGRFAKQRFDLANTSVSDELIADRRAEVALEQAREEVKT
jgi:bifunctional DNA-binding transcriptional regulator/antitoxin component of YhaV-PrlF toxin-antitoxin module